MQTKKNRRLLAVLLTAATVAAGSGLVAAGVDFDVAQALAAPGADKPFFAQRELTLSEHLH